MCFLFSLQPCVMLLLLLHSLSQFKGKAGPSSNFSCVHSCSSTFSLAPSASRASSSAFSRKSSSSSSYFSLSSSTRRASSSASIRVCSSSFYIRLASRVRRTPTSTFIRALLPSPFHIKYNTTPSSHFLNKSFCSCCSSVDPL